MQTTGNPIMAIFLMIMTLLSSVGAPAKQPATTTETLYPAYQYVDGVQKWGYINPSGTFAIQPQFQQAESFGPEGLAAVERDGKYGLIDRAGEFVLQPIYDWIAQPSADGIRVAFGKANNSAISPQGKVLFSTPDSLGTFSDGLATILRRQGERWLYGYVNTAGDVVIEPQYLAAQPFANGKALVKVKDGQYAVITPTGERLSTLNVDWASKMGDDLVTFRDKASGLWGYMTVSGDVVIPAQFGWAYAFEDGVAIVEAKGQGSGNRLGLINREGKYVIAPKYSSLVSVGGGYYAVGEPMQTYTPGPYHKKAIFTADGTQLTDFLFYEVGKFAHDVIPVTDETGAYFVDENGEEDITLPTVAGFGTLQWEDGLIRSQQDKDMAYLTPDGETVWQSDRSFTLPSGIRVQSVKYRPSRFLLVYYPQFSGLPNAEAQATINSLVKDFFPHQPPNIGDSHDSLPVDVTVDFAVKQVKNLLAIEKSGYDYPIGAAHGMPSRDYLHVDARTGQSFTLADLFKPGAAYTQRLSELVNQQIAARPQNGFFPDAKAEVKPTTIFTVKEDALVLAFPPYELAPYAAGFPTFEIPFSELKDLTNTEGAFWQAFH